MSMPGTIRLKMGNNWCSLNINSLQANCKVDDSNDSLVGKGVSHKM